MSKGGFFSGLFKQKSNAEQDSPKVDKRTLKELQEDIYSREDDILKESAEAKPNQEIVAEKEKKIAADKELLAARLAELTKKQGELVTSIAGTPKNPNQAAQKQQETWTKELQAVKKEIEKYQEFVAKREAEQKKAAEKLQAKNDKAVEKAKLSYKEEKEKTYKIANDLLKDKEGLKQLLLPLAAPRKASEGISTGEKFKTGMQALGYAFNHASTVVSVIGSASFYSDEMEKAKAVLSGEEKYDPSNPPFFIQLLKDPDTVKLLERNVLILDSLVADFYRTCKFY